MKKKYAGFTGNHRELEPVRYSSGLCDICKVNGRHFQANRWTQQRDAPAVMESITVCRLCIVDALLDGLTPPLSAAGVGGTP